MSNWCIMDLWDYDLPAAPNLVEITVHGQQIKAVAQVTKQGFCFVFDRVTGKPIWPIEERAVPQSTVPGEKSSPTQPVPSRPAPFERQGITRGRRARLYARAASGGAGNTYKSTTTDHSSHRRLPDSPRSSSLA